MKVINLEEATNGWVVTAYDSHSGALIVRLVSLTFESALENARVAAESLDALPKEVQKISLGTL